MDEAPERSQTVRLACPLGHVVESDADTLEVTHTRDTLLGVQFWCAECETSFRVVLPPASIALLLELGVSVATEPLGPEEELVASSEHRRTLSNSVLRRDVHVDLP